MADRNPRFNPVGMAIIAAALLYGCTYAAFGRTLPDDMGGDVREYHLRTLVMQLRGDTARITNKCASACTLYLSVGCVTPNARLMFHSPFGGTPQQIQEARELLASAYPPALATWYLAGPAYLTGGDFAELSGAQAIQMGVKQCGKGM